MFNFKRFIRFTLLSLATCFLAGLNCQATATHEYTYQIILDIAPETLRGVRKKNIDRTLLENLKGENKTQLSKTLLEKICDVIASPDRNLFQEGDFIRNFEGSKKWGFWEKMKGKTLITFKVNSDKGIEDLIKKNKENKDLGNPYLVDLKHTGCFFEHFKLNGYEWGEIQLNTNMEWIETDKDSFKNLGITPLRFQKEQPEVQFTLVQYDLTAEKNPAAIKSKMLEKSFIYNHTKELKFGSFYYKDKPYLVDEKVITQWEKMGDIRKYFNEKIEGLKNYKEVFFPKYESYMRKLNFKSDTQGMYRGVESYDKYLDKKVKLPSLHPISSIPCKIKIGTKPINDSKDSALKKPKVSHFAPSTEKKDIKVALQDYAKKFLGNKNKVAEMLLKPCAELFPIMGKKYFQALMPMLQFEHFFENLSEEKKRALLFNFYSDNGLKAKTELERAKKLMRACIYIMGTLGLKLWQNHLAELDLRELKNQPWFTEYFSPLKEVANLVFSYDFLLTEVEEETIKEVVEGCNIKRENIKSIRSIKAASVAHTAKIELIEGGNLVIKYLKPGLSEKKLKEEEEELDMDSSERKRDLKLVEQVRRECDFEQEEKNWKICQTQYVPNKIATGISCVQKPKKWRIANKDAKFALLLNYVEGGTLTQVFKKVRQGDFVANTVIKLGNRVKQVVCHWLHNLLFVNDIKMIHGDLHGGNILYSIKTGKAVVIDFGVVIDDFISPNSQKRDFFKQFLVLATAVYEDLKKKSSLKEKKYWKNKKKQALINHFQKRLPQSSFSNLKNKYNKYIKNTSENYKSLEDFRKEFCRILKVGAWGDQEGIAREIGIFDKPMDLIREFNEAVESWDKTNRLKIIEFKKTSSLKIKPITLKEMQTNNCSINIVEEEKKPTSEDDISDQNHNSDNQSEQESESDTKDDETDQNPNDNKPPNKQESNIEDEVINQNSSDKRTKTTTIVIVFLGMCLIAGGIYAYVAGRSTKQKKRRKQNRNQYKEVQVIRASV